MSSPTTYIYFLTDPRNDYVKYVGKTNNPKERFRNHTNIARDKNTHKRNWLNQLRAEGLKPAFEIVDEVPIDNWQFWESFWIGLVKSWGFKLTNNTAGGEGTSYGNQTSFKEGDNAKSVVGYNKNFELIYEFDSADKASRHLKLNRSNIPACCSKALRSKTACGLAWFYKDDVSAMSPSELQANIHNRFTIIYKPNSGQYQKGCNGVRSKMVMVENAKTGEKQVLKSSVEAAKLIGVNQSGVSWAIKHDKLLSKKRYKVYFYE